MKSFLHGKKTLTVEPLRPPLGTTGLAVANAVRAPKCEAGENGGPAVEVVKQGDKVVRLIVTCRCGERTEIECLYPAGG